MKFEEAIRQDKFNSPLQKAVLNMIFTAAWFRDHFRKVHKDEPIEQQHFNVMRILKGKHPHTVTPGDIKAVMLDKAPDVTRLVDKLVKLGWVHRETAADDRRKVDIGLTVKGLKKLEELNTRVQAETRAMKGRLTDAEATKLSDLLDKLRG